MNFKISFFYFYYLNICFLRKKFKKSTFYFDFSTQQESFEIRNRQIFSLNNAHDTRMTRVSQQGGERIEWNYFFGFSFMQILQRLLCHQLSLDYFDFLSFESELGSILKKCFSHKTRDICDRTKAEGRCSLDFNHQ